MGGIVPEPALYNGWLVPGQVRGETYFVMGIQPPCLAHPLQHIGAVSGRDLQAGIPSEARNACVVTGQQYLWDTDVRPAVMPDLRPRVVGAVKQPIQCGVEAVLLVASNVIQHPWLQTGHRIQ